LPADAIVADLTKPAIRSGEEAHGLFLKLFAEYGNALEIAGAWGWAIRTRRQHKLLLDVVNTRSPCKPPTVTDNCTITIVVDQTVPRP
jgi:hypothetical protein